MPVNFQPLKSVVPALQVKALSLLVAGLIIVPSVFAQSKTPFIHLAECNGNARADASLVNRGRRIVIALEAQQRSTARAGAVVEPIPEGLTVGDFDESETEIDFDFDGAPPHVFNLFALVSYRQQSGNIVTRDVNFDDSTPFDSKIKLRRNSDGSYSGRVFSKNLIEESRRTVGINTPVTRFAIVYDPFFANKRDIPRVFVRNITFLGRDLDVNTRIGVGGCSLIPEPNR